MTIWIQPDGPNTKPQHAQNHELLSSAHPDIDGFEALRWAGDPTVFCAGTIPETEFIALPWQCEYCGNTNPGEALYCGQCGPSHCGAPKPGCEEPPRGVLHLPNISKEQWEQALSPKPPSAPVDFYADFYPEPTMRVVSHPGKSAEDFKLELGRRLLTAFQKAVRGALSLC